MICIVKNFRRYKNFSLPDELAVKVIRLLLKKRHLDESVVTPLLSPNLLQLDLSGCENVNIARIVCRCPNVESVSLLGA